VSFTGHTLHAPLGARGSKLWFVSGPLAVIDRLAFALVTAEPQRVSSMTARRFSLNWRRSRADVPAWSSLTMSVKITRRGALRAP
jgi:hypothetical protein